MAESISSGSASSGSASSELVAQDFEMTFDLENRGRNIKVENDGLAASKIKKGAKEALVVTNRPIVSNELFEISVGGGSGFKGVKGEMKARLKGKESVRIGVTVHCPSDVCSFSTQHSLKRMTSGTWMMMSESIIENGETIKSLKYNLNELSVNDRVGIIRVPEFNGSLIIYINGAPIGIIATSVPDRVYGFVELQGECERVSLTRNRLVKHEALPIEIRSMRDRANEIHKLQHQMGERDQQILVLNTQMELLRTQLMASRNRAGTNGTLKTHHQDDGRESRETQTMQMLEIQSNGSTTERRRRKRACIIC